MCMILLEKSVSSFSITIPKNSFLLSRIQFTFRVHIGFGSLKCIEVP